MSRFFARLAISIAAMLVALIAALMAVGYFAFALYLFILDYLDPPLAAAATGVSILVLSMLLVAAIRLATGRRRRRRIVDDPSLEAAESAAELGNVLGRKLRGLAEAHGNASRWAVLAAGFAAGASPKLRKFLRDTLKL